MHATGQPHPVEKSRELQRKLYLAAKKCRNRRFHALYDRIFRPDVLWLAWQEVRANGGSAGLDGVTLEDVEHLGVWEFLRSIAADLKAKRYRPKPVLRVYIPKPDGRKRPLGIPTVRDRVVQQACKIVIEPIFEANFQEHSYGFRPKRSADGVAHEAKVTVGFKQGDSAQITGGLQAGQQVVTKGAYGLPDKTKITVGTSKPSAAEPGKDKKEADKDKD